MNTLSKIIIVIIGLFIMLLSGLVVKRHWVMMQVMASDQPLALLEGVGEGRDVTWFDDYFTIEVINDHTYAIGEPRYAQQNYNYLILGETRAILFDAGSGYRDIRPLVQSLTDLPVTFVPSHFHYDHIGNDITFDRVAVISLPHILDRIENGQLQLTWQEHLGTAEGYSPPKLKITEWLFPGGTIDLGGRKLEIMYTPGHTDDSISLFDRDAGALFAGDFLYPGALYAFLPNSSLADYERGAEELMANLPMDVTIYGGHREGEPGVPRLTFEDLGDLKLALLKIREGRLAGEGLYPVSYKINTNLVLLAEPAMLQDWRLSYPLFGMRSVNASEGESIK